MPPPRDLKGYGRHPPNPQWPDGARIAVNFVINYEEGAEHTVLNDDEESETYLNELNPPEGLHNERDYAMESQFDYGSRVGIWRLLRLFEKHRYPVTIFAVGKALELYPEIGPAFVEAGHELCSHGYRWVAHQGMPEEVERAQIHKAIDALTAADPQRRPPRGWCYVRASSNSHRLVSEVYKERGIELLYNSDAYSDDLPYWTTDPAGTDRGLLMVPYSFENNDANLAMAHGFSGAGELAHHYKNAFDTLYEEGVEGSPKMLTIALHCRLIGKPGRFPAIKKLVEHIASHENVWIATREDIARHWRNKFPYRPKA